MNTSSFFSAVPAAATPSALPETHPIDLPNARAESGSFSNALQRAASAKENFKPRDNSSVSKSSPRSNESTQTHQSNRAEHDSVKPRDEKGEAGDSSKSESASADAASKDEAKAKKPDSATMEAMACLCAASVVTLPVPPVLTVALGDTGTLSQSAEQTAVGDATSSGNQAALMQAPALPATGQLSDSLFPGLTSVAASDAKPDPTKANPNAKSLVDLVKPLGLQPLEKPEESKLTAAEVEAAAAEAAKASTLKADAAKVEGSAASAQIAPTIDKAVADAPKIPTGADVRNGTPVAQREGDMRKTVKRSENAELAEQKLPGRGNSYSGAADAIAPSTAVGGVFAEGRSRNGVRPDADDAPMPALNLPTATVSFSEAAPKQAVAGAAGVTPADRVQNLMATEISRFKQMKLDSMSVVLRPDPQTEISLSVKMSDGKIEAHAICERGDFNGLSAQWGQLQQSLSRQQVELAPLRDANTQNGNSDQAPSRGFSQSQGNPQPREEKPKTSFADELAPLRSNAPTTKAAPRPMVTVINGRRWETWA